MLNVILFIILIAIIFSLGSALKQMLSDDGSSEKMLKALAWRVALSASFLVLLMVLYKLGYIEYNIAPK